MKTHKGWRISPESGDSVWPGSDPVITSDDLQEELLSCLRYRKLRRRVSGNQKHGRPLMLSPARTPASCWSLNNVPQYRVLE